MICPHTNQPANTHRHTNNSDVRVCACVCLRLRLCALCAIVQVVLLIVRSCLVAGCLNVLGRLLLVAYIPVLADCRLFAVGRHEKVLIIT